MGLLEYILFAAIVAQVLFTIQVVCNYGSPPSAQDGLRPGLYDRFFSDDHMERVVGICSTAIYYYACLFAAHVDIRLAEYDSRRFDALGVSGDFNMGLPS